MTRFISRLALAALAVAPLLARAQSAAVLEGLSQDVASLRDEVRKLRAEVEELREAQAAQAKAPKPSGPTSGELASVNARIAAVETAAATARTRDKAEVLAEADRKMESLRASVNKSLAEQTRQVNEALRGGGSVRANEAAKPAEPKADTKASDLPADMPKTGVRYTVQPGDTIPKIARKMNSKSAWILAANGLKSTADLKAYAVIFIPQAEGAAKAE